MGVAPIGVYLKLTRKIMECVLQWKALLFIDRETFKDRGLIKFDGNL